MASAGKGGDGYWPGFVDALTNVVIAMVFVIVVLAIALSFSAQLLAQRMAAKLAELQQVGPAKVAVADPAPNGSREPSADTPTPPSRQRTPAPIDARVQQQVRIPVSGNESGASPTAVATRAVERFVLLEFTPSALTLDDPAQRRLVESLEPFRQALQAAGPTAKIAIVAKGPAMSLSENQRSAYIRVMAVRNVVIDQGFSADRITTRIETQESAPNASVSLSLQATP